MGGFMKRVKLAIFSSLFIGAFTVGAQAQSSFTVYLANNLSSDIAVNSQVCHWVVGSTNWICDDQPKKDTISKGGVITKNIPANTSTQYYALNIAGAQTIDGKANSTYPPMTCSASGPPYTPKNTFQFTPVGTTRIGCTLIVSRR